MKDHIPGAWVADRASEQPGVVQRAPQECIRATLGSKTASVLPSDNEKKSVAPQVVPDRKLTRNADKEAAR
jgi:hypothetical protein